MTTPDTSFADRLTISAQVGLIRRLTEALELANGVLLKRHFTGTDQNPMGIHDVVGSAAGEGRRYLTNYERRS
jgi:hypothetical protein